MPNLDTIRDADALAVLINLLCAIVMAQVLAWHYVRFARVLANKRKFARIFVFVTCTTLLMISVVKTSLALSLGLVGALSIIRFRTPIKEPEELAYLFLAIAVGVGLGADELVITALVFSVLLVAMMLLSGRRSDPPVRTILQIGLPIRDGDADGMLDRLVPIVESECASVDVRRVDVRGERFDTAMSIEVSSADALGRLISSIRAGFAGADVTFIERDGLD